MKRKKIRTQFIKMYGTKKGKNVGNYGSFEILNVSIFKKTSKWDAITQIVFLQNEQELKEAEQITGLTF